MRSPTKLVCAAWVVGSLACVGCGSSNHADGGCAAGEVSQGGACVAAVDAAPRTSAPPVFNGITTFTGDPVWRSATIGWDAATDDDTSASAIVYDVYTASSSMGESFMAPIATSGPGATTIDLSGLTPDTGLYFIVRARDADGNHDSNTVERWFTTNVSFSVQLQPLLSSYCGVVGCHVPGNPTGGLVLATGFSYAGVVGVPAIEPASANITMDGSVIDYVSPGSPDQSYLYIKTHADAFDQLTQENPDASLGTRMPAPSTGSTLQPSELDAIERWIEQGAVNN